MEAGQEGPNVGCSAKEKKIACSDLRSYKFSSVPLIECRNALKETTNFLLKYLHNQHS
jgi:hypothetical protein